MPDRSTSYVPAAGHDFLLPLYDPMLRVLGRERAFRTRLLEQADVGPHDRLLDVGCGTGTFAILVKRSRPDADIVGVDGDPKALARARRKAERAGVRLALDEALATHLPYADASFDRVTSSLVLHHLTHDEKLAALREIRRVLRPGGSFHLADFGPAVTPLGRLAALHFGPSERMRDHRDGRLPELLREAGLSEVRALGHHATVFGTIHFHAAIRARADEVSAGGAP